MRGLQVGIIYIVAQLYLQSVSIEALYATRGYLLFNLLNYIYNICQPHAAAAVREGPALLAAA